MYASLGTCLGGSISANGYTVVIDRMGEGAGWAISCCIYNLQYVQGGQLLDSTPVVQGIVLCIETFVEAEGTGFVWSVANWSFGVIFMSGRVIQADLFDCNISKGDVVIKVQRREECRTH